jgi:hypothetical protein
VENFPGVETWRGGLLMHLEVPQIFSEFLEKEKNEFHQKW